MSSFPDVTIGPHGPIPCLPRTIALSHPLSSKPALSHPGASPLAARQSPSETSFTGLPSPKSLSCRIRPRTGDVFRLDGQDIGAGFELPDHVVDLFARLPRVAAAFIRSSGLFAV